jgi:hypothetical protein
MVVPNRKGLTVSGGAGLLLRHRVPQSLDHHLGHTPLVHLGHPQLPAVALEPLAFLGNVAEGVEEKSAEGHVFAFGSGRPG